MIPDTRHTVAYRHICQPTATIESIIPDIHNRVRYCHICKSTATMESIIPDVRNRIRYCHARKSATTIECPPTNARHGAWYHHAHKLTATIKRISPDTRHPCRNDKISDIFKWYVAFRPRNSRFTHIYATGKCRRVDACAVRYRHLRQPAATGECTIPDADTRHAVQYRHTHKTIAIGERIPPYTNH